MTRTSRRRRRRWRRRTPYWGTNPGSQHWKYCNQNSLLLSRRVGSLGPCHAITRCGFSRSLNHMAMIQAIYLNSDVFVPQINSMKSDISLQTSISRAILSALIDSGATKNCIHPRIIKGYNLPWQKLAQPHIICNSDNSVNHSGIIKRVVHLDLQYAGKQIPYQFLVADIGDDEMILGYPFLISTNPSMDWKNARNTNHLLNKSTKIL